MPPASPTSMIDTSPAERDLADGLMGMQIQQTTPEGTADLPGTAAETAAEVGGPLGAEEVDGHPDDLN